MTLRNLRFFLIPLLIFALAACGGPIYRSYVINTPGNRGLKSYEKPYVVNGRRYDPLRRSDGFVQEGMASWYGRDFHGRQTSNGETYNMYAMTAAHKTLPLGVYVKVHNEANGREAVVRINDRGPFVKGRIIDLSYAAAKRLGVVGPGTAPVRIEALGYRVSGQGPHRTYRQPVNYDVGTFSVQIGAFSIAVNARRLASRMQSRYGYAGIQMGSVGGRHFYRVRVGKFSTLQAAQTAQEHLERSGYPNSFVVALE